MPETFDFSPGDRVNVTVEGARIDEVVKNGIHLVMPNGTTARIELSNYEGLTVERVAPAEWPPRPGDLWRDANSSVWFALFDNYGRKLVMVPADPTKGLTGHEPDKVLANLGPLTLVHREGGEPS